MKVITKYPVYINEERFGQMDNQYLYAGGLFENVKEKLSSGVKFAEEKGFVDPVLGLFNLQKKDKGISAEEIAAMERQKAEEEKKEAQAKRKKNIMTMSIVGGVVVLGIVVFVLLRKK